jgi:pyruvate formate lyase activating enzyme
MITGLVSHIQRFSLHDGPGIRTTVFLKGCPLRCLWCHNPENRSALPEKTVIAARCIRCGQCAEVCPEGNLQQSADDKQIPGTSGSLSSCPLCGACAVACPTGARQLVGRWHRAESLARELLADRIFFEESGGGITVSGGEPLMQPEFLGKVLTVLRRHEVHTAIDTCGYAPRAVLERMVPVTSLFLYDLKAVSDTDHQACTGVSNRLILENLQWLAQAHDCIWLRCPIIPGMNDSPGELEAKARLAGQWPSIRQINLLPYHRIGQPKFERLGLEDSFPHTEPPSAERMREIAGIFRSRGLAVKIGG